MASRKELMEIIHKMCNFQSSSCRGLDMVGWAEVLLHKCGIPHCAEIGEIPVADREQVIILFSLPRNKYYYSLFVGIGRLDKKFHIEFQIEGILPNTNRFRFLEPAIHIPCFNEGFELKTVVKAAVWESYSNSIAIINSLKDSILGVDFKEVDDYFNYQWTTTPEAGDIILCVLQSMGIDHQYKYAIQKERE